MSDTQALQAALLAQTVELQKLRADNLSMSRQIAYLCGLVTAGKTEELVASLTRMASTYELLQRALLRQTEIIQFHEGSIH